MSFRPLKHIRTTCYGPIVLGEDSPWEDVWIQLFISGRRSMSFGPCIISLPSLDWDLEHEAFLIERSEDCRQQFYDMQVTKARLLSGEMFVADRLFSPKKKYSGIPNIYAAAQTINKQIAEEACWWWLLESGIVWPGVEPRFHWNRPSPVIRSVG